MTEVVKVTPAEAGCWVDGHWGQYALAHLIEKADDCGYPNEEIVELALRHLLSMGPNYSGEELTEDEWETLVDSHDEVDRWMNENVAPEGFQFGWFEGEYFLWQQEEWDSVGY